MKINRLALILLIFFCIALAYANWTTHKKIEKLQVDFRDNIEIQSIRDRSILKAGNTISNAVYDDVERIVFNPDDYETEEEKQVAIALNEGPEVYTAKLVFYAENDSWPSHQNDIYFTEWMFSWKNVEVPKHLSVIKEFEDHLALDHEILQILEENGYVESIVAEQKMGSEELTSMYEIKRSSLGTFKHRHHAGNDFLIWELPLFKPSQIISVHKTDRSTIYLEHCHNDDIVGTLEFSPVSQLGEMLKDRAAIHMGYRFFHCFGDQPIVSWQIMTPPIHEIR